ncbi:sugar transporter SWEET1 isoform X2 [Apis cerana]|uniref:sugar transporter SWEET1 isoform X2 n=1 Tax=Apis cerana TaxID=7461 RepID=UPI00109BBD1F|nr:sugar transporter SWEET1 isoform X2 [Apis cerana]
MISTKIRDVLATTASICTVLQFLAGVLVCRKIIKNGSTGNSSALAFVTCYTSVKKFKIIRQIIAATCFLGIVYFYSFYEQDRVLAAKYVGFLSCTITVLFFASPLMMLAHVIKVKNTETLPFPIIMASFIVSSQWFVYGCLLNDLFIQIPNFLGCILSAFQLCFFLIYRNDHSIMLI